MNLNVEKNLRNFFDKYFWGQHPEAALRYAPVVSEIKKAGAPLVSKVELIDIFENPNFDIPRTPIPS